MIKYLGAALAVAILAAAVLGWLLKTSYETNGKLKESNAQLTAAINAKVEATKSRATTDSRVRRLAPADVIERLR